jgi:Fe-S cluster assembly protein SufD
MFDPGHIPDLPGPAWLRERRLAAAERLVGADLPTPEQEEWRYSRIGELDPARWSLLPASSAPTAAGPHPGSNGLSPLAAAVERPAGIVRIRNGQVVQIDVHADGLQIARLGELDDGDELLGRAMPTPVDVFAEANLAFAAEPVVVRTVAGASVEGPVLVEQSIDADGAAVLSRLVVVAEPDSRLTVVDVHTSAPVVALSIPVTESLVHEGAHLRLFTVQDLAPTVWQIGNQAADIGADAHMLVALAAMGGDYARHRIDTAMTGRGGQGDIVAIYHGRGDQTLDFRTFQDHLAPDTRSELLFKGAVDDRSRSIYSGLIHIAKDAPRVTAFQTNRNIKLSADAWAESVPNLEIENNDVSCSHASAVGPVDDDQSFYLQSRGVPTEIAERLVVLGAYGEVLVQLPDAGVARELGRLLAVRLDAPALVDAL